MRKEIDKLNQNIRKIQVSSHKDYEKLDRANQTLMEAKKDYEEVKQEITEWLKISPLAPAYKESCTDYYIKGATNKVNNIERELKRCLGEV